MEYMARTDLPFYVQLDENTRPQDDFYGYACGHWLADNPLPPTRQKWGPLDVLNAKTQKQLRGILRDWLAKNSNLTDDEKQVVTYYRTLISKDDYQKNSLRTLRQHKRKIETAIEDNGSPSLLAEFFKLNVRSFFVLGTDIDPKDSSRFCLTITPSSLDLPNRDYYLSDNAKIKTIRKRYLDFLAGYDQKLNRLGLASGLQPTEILEIETVLAKLSWPLNEAIDRLKTHNPYGWRKFQQSFEFDWPTYFKTIGIEVGKQIIVSQPSHLEKVLRYLKELPPKRLRGYLIHKFMLHYGEFLNEEMMAAQFAFFDKILGGAREIKPLEERVSEDVDAIFCDVIGKAYVKRHFPGTHKHEVEKLADDICQAFLKRLANNSWMTPASRKFAQDKLSKIIVNIGYSGIWTDYGRLDLSDENPVANSLKAEAMRQQINFKLLHQKPKRQRLHLIEENAQVVNAWTYENLLNTSYPAAILQAPVYDHEASFAYNLGALGSIIGHELTHNFDDQGARYDQDGNLNPWLNTEEQQAFKVAAAKLVQKADAHCPVPGIHMKGNQVISELIADLGGMEIIMDVVRAKYPEKEVRLAAMRTVFIASALIFARHVSPEMHIIQAKSGVHPDHLFRTNGIFPHCDDFYEVFDVKKSDKLYLPPEERAKIW